MIGKIGRLEKVDPISPCHADQSDMGVLDPQQTTPSAFPVTAIIHLHHKSESRSRWWEAGKWLVDKSAIPASICYGDTSVPYLHAQRRDSHQFHSV